MKTTPAGNMDYWREYGDFVLMAMPYADEVLVKAHAPDHRADPGVGV